MVTRTWQEVMDALARNKRGSTQERYARAINDRAFDPIRALPVMESRSEHFLEVLANQRSSTNLYLRRIHNFALGMDWLLKPIIPRLEWPKVVYGDKRAITWDEHQRIIAREPNQERRNFYELLWHLGGSQSDVANLQAEDIDWEDQTIGYDRCKTKNRSRRRIKPPIIHFGEAVAGILKRLPERGPLFPYLRNVAAKYRSTEFHQRCAGLGIKGVSLHSYRYAWAERARKCGFPMRFAQEALGHNSKAVHAAYSSKAEVKVPSLDTWEREMAKKVVKMKFMGNVPEGEIATELGAAAITKEAK